MHGVDGVGGEPAGIGVLFQGEIAIAEVAEVAVHGEVEVGVVVFDSGLKAIDHDGGVKLFFDFTEEGFLMGLSWLHLAAWKLPPATPLAIAALGGEDAAAVEDDGSDHFDVPQGLFGSLLSFKKHLRRTVDT